MNPDIQNIVNDPLLVTALYSTPLFHELNKSEFNIIIDILLPVYIKKGDAIFYEGDEGEVMYVFLQGAMNAYIKQADGTQRKVFDVELGNFFGEMSIIAHEPRSATIIAEQDSTLIAIGKADFYKIISQYPGIGVKMLKYIGAIQTQWLDQSSKSYNDLIRWGETARRRAITDEMTGLYNFRFLEDSLKERLGNESMKLRVISLLMMDLDKIHSINDTHGPKGGDLVITAAAEEIAAILRSDDIPARLAGDEFAIILPDTDTNNAYEIADQIRANIEKRQVEVPASPGSEATVSISTCTSIGIATAPLHAGMVSELMEAADTALRKAKELGRNRVEVASP